MSGQVGDSKTAKIEDKTISRVTSRGSKTQKLRQGRNKGELKRKSNSLNIWSGTKWYQFRDDLFCYKVLGIFTCIQFSFHLANKGSLLTSKMLINISCVDLTFKKIK